MKRLEQLAAERGQSSSAVIEQALEQYLADDSNVQLNLLRAVFVMRELLLDMSTRPPVEKEKLWEAMTNYTKNLLRGAAEESASV